MRTSTHSNATRTLVLAAATALLAAGCSSASKSATPAFTSIEGYRSQQAEWGQCDSDWFVKAERFSSAFNTTVARCTTVKVPAVYDGSAKLADFSLALMMLPSTGKAPKKGVLFLNPGGPGESGVDQVQWMEFPQAVRDRYDIIGFDPRGVKNSQPADGQKISCDDKLDFATYWVLTGPVRNAQDEAKMKAASDEYYADCKKRNPSWWVLGTKNVVQDLDVMREVLTADEPLNFFGSSYGTTIAAEYIRAYPQHVGRITLNSPTDTSTDNYDRAIIQAKAREASIMRFVDGYAKAKGKTRAQVQALMLEVADWAAKGQMRGFMGIKPSDDGRSRQSNLYMFTHGIMALTYYDNTEAQSAFNDALDAAYGEKWLGSFEYFGMNLDGYDPKPMYDAFSEGKGYSLSNLKRDNSYEIMTMVNAMDRDGRDLHTHAEMDAQDKRARAAAPFGSKLSMDDGSYVSYPERPGNEWSWFAFEDKTIPDPPATIAARVNTSGKPVLVVGSRLEATTPYSFAQATARDLKSPLVTYEGSGHAPLLSVKNACLDAVFINYMVNDTLPTSAVSCAG